MVVKFIKSDFREQFISDVSSLRSFIKFVLFFYPKLQKVADPLGILDTIEKGTLDELAISSVGDKMRRGLFMFFEALSTYDNDKCAYCLNKMADLEIAGREFDAFKTQFLELYADFADTTVAEVSLTKKMMQTIKLGVNSGMVFEKGMYTIIKSLMYMDGMVLRCNPDAILMRDIKNFVQEFKKFVTG